MADKTFHSLTLPGTDPARVPDVAAEFNTGTSYAVRDYCTYQGVLYRCTAAHAAGAWNASHFQATNLDNEFDDKLKVPPYQSSAPANPRVGDLWIDDDEDSSILNIDPAPIAGSTNAVQSGGTRTLIDGVSVQKANRNLLTGDYSTSATYEVGQLVLYYPETFSTTHQYIVGESCIHNKIAYKCIVAHKGSWNASHFQQQYTVSTDTLYRCITRIGTSEAWTPAHWQATNINTELNRLRESEADTDMIAENYGDSSSYAVGDYVVHNSDLFRCISAVSDTGSWDPDDWEQVALANDVSDLKSAISVISSNTAEVVPITAETFLYTAESTLTETYIADGVELAYTATANPIVFYAVDNLEAGHSYKLQYKVKSGALSVASNQKMGTGVGTTFVSIPTEASFNDGVMTLEFTATATTHALQIAMVYSSKDVTLTTFRIINTSIPEYIINNDVVKDLSESNLSTELIAKINKADEINEIIVDHVPENFFPFTQEAIIANTTPVTVIYSENNINLTFTETANPLIIWKIDGLSPGKEYTVSFTVSSGNLNTVGCLLRKYLQSAPESGEFIKLLQFDGDKCVTTFTMPTGETKVSLCIGMVYSSKSVTLSDMTIKDAGAEEYLAIKASAENRNNISASFIYSTQTGDCTILKILGDEKDEVVMVDSSAPVAWDNIKAALDKDAIFHVDYFILSHWHGDHMGCIDLLHQNGYIDEDTTFYLPEDPDATSQGLIRDDNPDKIVVQRCQEYLALLTEWGCTKVYPQENDILEVNDCKFQFWNCDHADYYASSWVDYNECSLCCAMIYGTTVLQFTGDIGPVACQKYYNKSLPCNIFKANHHACGYTVVPLFMSAMCPDIVVTMAGSAIVYSTDPAIQAVFATLSNGLQQWCENEFVPNFVTGVIKANIYMQLDKTGYKFLSNARRCVRSDEGIPVSS